MKIMNIKKGRIYIVVFCLILVVTVIWVINNIEIENIEEINPVEEISKEDEEKIIIHGYYFDKELNEIIKKEILMSNAEIREDMYKNILNRISIGEEDENVESLNEIINLNIDKVVQEDNTVNVYFINNIQEFEILDENRRKNVVEIINKTMFEINGIEKVNFYFNNIQYIPSV